MLSRSQLTYSPLHKSRRRIRPTASFGRAESAFHMFTEPGSRRQRVGKLQAQQKESGAHGKTVAIIGYVKCVRLPPPDVLTLILRGISGGVGQ